MYSVCLLKKPAALNFRIKTKFIWHYIQEDLNLEKNAVTFYSNFPALGTVNVCNISVSFHDTPSKDNFWKMNITVARYAAE